MDGAGSHGMGMGRRWLVVSALFLLVGTVLLIPVLRSARPQAITACLERGRVTVDGRLLAPDMPVALRSGVRLDGDEDGAAELRWPDVARLHCTDGARLTLDGGRGETAYLDHGTLAAAGFSVARGLTVLTPQAQVRVEQGAVRIAARGHQTVVMVEDGVAQIASRAESRGPRRVAAGGEALIGNQGWEAETDAPHRLLPWSDAHILATVPTEAVLLHGSLIHGLEVRRVIWTMPSVSREGTAGNGIVWPLRLTGRERRCAIWLRARRVEAAAPETQPGMGIELHISGGGTSYRIARIRIAARDQEWTQLGGDCAQAVLAGGGGVGPALRVEAVQAVMLMVGRGAVTLELGPLLVETPVAP